MPFLVARYPTSLRTLQRVKGWPRLRGRSVAVLTMSWRSSVVIRRGRPPAHGGSSAPIPLSLKEWIISLTRSGLVWTSRAIAATSLPPAEASTTRARRHLTMDLSVLPPPRRTIRWSCLPSSSDSRRTFTGVAMGPVCATGLLRWWTRPRLVVRALVVILLRTVKGNSAARKLEPPMK